MTISTRNYVKRNRLKGSIDCYRAVHPSQDCEEETLVLHNEDILAHLITKSMLHLPGQGDSQQQHLFVRLLFQG